MPPEMFDNQIEEEGTYNYKLTIYAVGIVFYHLWQLKKPFSDCKE
jgi:hypothetical protein